MRSIELQLAGESMEREACGAVIDMVQDDLELTVSRQDEVQGLGFSVSSCTNCHRALPCSPGAPARSLEGCCRDTDISSSSRNVEKCIGQPPAAKVNRIRTDMSMAGDRRRITSPRSSGVITCSGFGGCSSRPVACSRCSRCRRPAHPGVDPLGSMVHRCSVH